ncbi:hypothetical protein ABIB28_000591 [Sphingomonas sp. UYEF23]
MLEFAGEPRFGRVFNRGISRLTLPFSLMLSNSEKADYVAFIL